MARDLKKKKKKQSSSSDSEEGCSQEAESRRSSSAGSVSSKSSADQQNILSKKLFPAKKTKKKDKPAWYKLKIEEHFEHYKSKHDFSRHKRGCVSGFKCKLCNANVQISNIPKHFVKRHEYVLFELHKALHRKGSRMTPDVSNCLHRFLRPVRINEGSQSSSRSSSVSYASESSSGSCESTQGISRIVPIVRQTKKKLIAKESRRIQCSPRRLTARKILCNDKKTTKAKKQKTVSSCDQNSQSNSVLTNNHNYDGQLNSMNNQLQNNETQERTIQSQDPLVQENQRSRSVSFESQPPAVKNNQTSSVCRDVTTINSVKETQERPVQSNDNELMPAMFDQHYPDEQSQSVVSIAIRDSNQSSALVNGLREQTTQNGSSKMPEVANRIKTRSQTRLNQENQTMQSPTTQTWESLSNNSLTSDIMMPCFDAVDVDLNEGVDKYRGASMKRLCAELNQRNRTIGMLLLDSDDKDFICCPICFTDNYLSKPMKEYLCCGKLVCVNCFHNNASDPTNQYSSICPFCRKEQYTDGDRPQVIQFSRVPRESFIDFQDNHQAWREFVQAQLSLYINLRHLKEADKKTIEGVHDDSLYCDQFAGYFIGSCYSRGLAGEIANEYIDELLLQVRGSSSKSVQKYLENSGKRLSHQDTPKCVSQSQQKDSARTNHEREEVKINQTMTPEGKKNSEIGKKETESDRPNSLEKGQGQRLSNCSQTSTRCCRRGCKNVNQANYVSALPCCISKRSLALQVKVLCENCAFQMIRNPQETKCWLCQQGIRYDCFTSVQQQVSPQLQLQLNEILQEDLYNMRIQLLDDTLDMSQKQKVIESLEFLQPAVSQSLINDAKHKRGVYKENSFIDSFYVDFSATALLGLQAQKIPLAKKVMYFNAINARLWLKWLALAGNLTLPQVEKFADKWLVMFQCVNDHYFVTAVFVDKDLIATEVCVLDSMTNSDHYTKWVKFNLQGFLHKLNSQNTEVPYRLVTVAQQGVNDCGLECIKWISQFNLPLLHGNDIPTLLGKLNEYWPLNTHTRRPAVLNKKRSHIAKFICKLSQCAQYSSNVNQQWTFIENTVHSHWYQQKDELNIAAQRSVQNSVNGSVGNDSLVTQIELVYTPGDPKNNFTQPQFASILRSNEATIEDHPFQNMACSEVKDFIPGPTNPTNQFKSPVRPTKDSQQESTNKKQLDQ